MSFSSLNRENMYKEMKNTTLDLIVIGGGITGSGIALDSANRGMKIALLDMDDFASGTSSKSTKLVHGGLRYLKQFQFGVVSEVGKERSIVFENAPHVTTPEWMLLPFYKGGNFGPLTTSIGLRIYDFLAGVRKAERRKMLKPKETLKREPLLKSEGIKGAGYYVEYKTDDARLTLETLKRAVEKGAIAINYAKVINLIYEDGEISGVEVEDQIDNNCYKVYAKKIVNATGPWVDTIREKDGSKQLKTLKLTKGVHLVFDGERFPLKQAIYFDAPDGRMIFAIPRDGKTYVGTTDTVYQGDISHPTVTISDRDYLLKVIEYMFPVINISALDVESSWAGLRPLIYEEGKDPSEISRKDEIFISQSKLISIAGGKLTGYRKMAEDVVDLVAKKLKEDGGNIFTKLSTKDLLLSGGDVGGSVGFESFKTKNIKNAIRLGIEEEEAVKLVSRYGSNITKLLDIYKTVKEIDNSQDKDLVICAMVKYSIEYELAYKPADFFVRRTGALFFDINWVNLNKVNIINYMSNELTWTPQQKLQYTEELKILLREAEKPSLDVTYPLNYGTN
ncbi:FAD-dependent oxidoreductase [Aquibacillus halophilus]|uniref:Glycerol-3-phosphate dehydrogenase n=1 Tax=Aquibacillus halophilus TaxID=930132 RepID=A0A6A8DB95_9BACI|nr:glycerol-3-phosphate dehydrogenase/oxidase [Aquibacillus halophilus]MRH41119.1 FAD-dependent oxidoreductase [Aquibacillus halophilus]